MDCVLDVHQPHHLQFDGDLAVVLVNGVDMLWRDTDRRDDTGRITRVDAGQLDVLHHGGYEGVVAVGETVGLDLDGVIQETIDEDRAFRGNVHGGHHVLTQHLLIMDYLHGSAAQHE